MQSKPLVIVADDSQTELAIIAESLLDWGYRVVGCQTGLAALQHAKDNPVLVLLDGMMPQMDGYEACRQIKALYPSTSVVIMTAHNNKAAMDQAFLSGADDYLAKPLYMPLLELRLKRIAERRNLQAELARREAHLKYVLEAGTDAYWDVCWEDGQPAVSLTMMRPLLPMAAGQTALEAFLANLHPDDKPRALAEAEAFLAGQQGDGLVQEFRARVKNGEWRWFFSRGRILARDPETGLPLKAGGVIADIHQQKSMESQLAEAQLLGRTGSWSLEAGAKQFSVSLGFCHLLGIEAGTTQYDIARLLDKVHPDDREALAVMYDQLWRRRDLAAFEFRTAVDSNAAAILQGEARVIFDADDKPVRLVGTLVDITERRRLESMMRDNLRRVHQFVEAVSDISFILDETGQYVQVFGKRPDLLIAAPEELLGKNVQEALPSGVAELLMKAIKKAFETGKQQDIEYELLVASNYKRFGGKLVPMQHAQAGRKTVALLLVDITSKHRTEEALRLSYERRRRNDFFNDLVAGKVQPLSGVEAIYGSCFEKGRCCSFALLVIESWRGENLASWLQNKRMQLQYVIDELVDRLSKTAGQIAWDAGAGKIGLIVLREGENYLSDQGFSDWLKVTEARFSGIRLRAGVASYGKEESMAQRYAEASQAIEVGTKIWPERNCYFFSELGVFQILLQVGKQETVERFIRQALGALLDYDQQKGAELVETLDAILAYPNLREAAEKLFIHYKTLLFRRKRIEALLDLSLEEAENRVSLSVAIRLWRLTRKQPETM